MEHIYTKINSLFQEYLHAAALENTENAKLSIEQKLIVTIWESNRDYKEYSVEVVEKIKESLVSFQDSEACKNGGQFSKYVYRAITNAINSAKEREAVEQRNGGIHIPDNVMKDIKKIKSLQKNLQKMNPDIEVTEDMLVEKAVAVLGIDEDGVRNLLKIALSGTYSFETPVNAGEDNGSLQDVIPDENPSVTDELVKQDKCRLLFSQIEKHWRKKSDPMLSELITVKILDAGMCIDNMEECSFLNREIYDNFQKDSHTLPDDSEIAEKYGLTKSAASKKLSRFWELIKS